MPEIKKVFYFVNTIKTDKNTKKIPKIAKNKKGRVFFCGHVILQLGKIFFALLYLDNLYAYEIICEIICDIMVHPQIQSPAHISF